MEARNGKRATDGEKVLQCCVAWVVAGMCRCAGEDRATLWYVGLRRRRTRGEDQVRGELERAKPSPPESQDGRSDRGDRSVSGKSSADGVEIPT